MPFQPSLAAAALVAALSLLAACGQPAAEPESAPPTAPDAPGSVAGAGHVSPAGDALVPGTDFNATGDVACAVASGQPMGRCSAGVIRNADGTATVVVTRPDGRPRAIFFKDGAAIGADASQADGAEALSGFTATKDADLFKIGVGSIERYEIPEAMVVGG